MSAGPAEVDVAARLAAFSRQVDSLMLADRRDVVRRLAAARRRLADNLPVDRTISQLETQIESSLKLVEARRSRLPTPTFDDSLPVSARREEIAAAIQSNQVVIVCGDTGSGKTTQLPKILLGLGRGIYGSIGHTQPRRIAARSVSQRIAEELNTAPGDVVGFKVRFTDQTRPHTLVRLMTDGILLAETQHDPRLEAYDTIIVDEAHERSLNIDFLLGYLKQLLPKRPDLKLIITSATIDPKRFSDHFDGAPIVMVEGRTFPVEVRYRPPTSDDPADAPFVLREGIIAAIDECMSNARGDVLVFLPGEREIRDVVEALGNERRNAFEVIPLFARLGVNEQMRVFRPCDKPKIVLATNVAETSLTVPGIRYVIDPGTARVNRYSTRQKLQRLHVEEISQASANQRKGRCGRVGPGVCVRLYSEQNFLERPPFTDPEILRTNLASVILQMLAYRLGRIEDFPFIDPPDYRQVKDGYQTLFELGAIDESNQITDLGCSMARLPIDPKVSRMILAADRLDCLREVLVIAAALSVQDPRDRPIDKQQLADEAHAKFRVGSSDFLAFLNLWDFYREQERQLSNNKLRKLCQAHFISPLRMREWQDVHSQLVELSNDLGLRVNTEAAPPERIHQALLAGLITNVGRRGEQGEYAGARSRGFWLFPGSALFHRKPAWVMAADIVETTKPYARIAAEVQPEWIERVGEHLVKRTHFEPHWNPKTGRVMAYEKVMLYGLPLVAKRSVGYETIDPVTSRQLFIQHALVEGDVELDAPFLRHNQALIREIELLEARTRRRDILVDPRTRFAFYDARIPANVTGLATFNAWRREIERVNKRLLFMTTADLMLRHESELGVEQFPHKISTNVGELELAYHFEPGHAADGVTLTLPLASLDAIDANRLDWLVPGLIEEKLIDLLRTLPKPLRVNFVPAPQFAADALRQMRFGEGSLTESFAAALGKLSGLVVRGEDFRPDELADYLKMNVKVIDAEGAFVAQGRNIAELRRRLRDRLRELLDREIDPQWRRDGLRSWDVGDLPERIEIKRARGTLQAFPGLCDQHTAAGLRLYDSPESARVHTREGVRRLFIIEYEKELGWHVSDTKHFESMCLHYKPLGSKQRLRSMLVEALAHRLITPDAAMVRTKMEHELQIRSAWNRLRSESTRLLDTARQTLEQWHAAKLRLDSLTVPDLLAASIDDIRSQLAALVPADFLLSTPKQWLDHLPRFVRAINIRLEKLLNAGLRRDTAALIEIAPRWTRYLDLCRAMPGDSVESADLVHYRWLMEELRVSLFAQELRTSTPVSIKRVDELWGQIVKDDKAR